MEISERTGMSETQIYKWWWDQTRKRMKKLKSFAAANERLAAESAASDEPTCSLNMHGNSKNLREEDFY
jgi:hypothetical protein